LIDLAGLENSITLTTISFITADFVGSLKEKGKFNIIQTYFPMI
jgi:hypothetical protein